MTYEQEKFWPCQSSNPAHTIGGGSKRTLNPQTTAISELNDERSFCVCNEEGCVRGGFALLGGEPLLNPHVIEHLHLAREMWPNANLMLFTNGFFLDRHPDLPATLVEIDCRLEVSQHGTHEPYLARFNEARKTVWQWRADYPGIQIKIRQSHRGWMRQYQVEDGKPMPFDSNPAAAFKICMQKTCTQLFRTCLFKCPALAYHALMEQRLRIETLPAWQLFRDYKACPPSSTDDDLRSFVETKAIPQCGLCPSKRVPFKHPNPTQRSVIR